MEPAETVARAQLLAPGARIGRYYLLRRLAIGGMAELHLACAEGVAGFQKVVVLKHVLPHLAADPDFVRLFLNEARLAANLDHPNVVSVIDIGETKGEFFYAMEYVHGHNAREVLRDASNRGGMPLEVALTIAMGAALGLHCAHEAIDLQGRPLGLVHRDVSPANLLLSYDGAVKLTDFGIAKAVERRAETIGGAVKGKIGYMSPEQCRGEPVDRRSDVYALGVVLFELTTCEKLFYADNDFAILHNVIHGDHDRPSDRVEDYPAELEAIVMRALAVDPEERYLSADALRRDLETFAQDERLRTSAAVVAEWMQEVYGRPPYPKVELLPPDEGVGPSVPTLVVAPPVGGTEVAIAPRAAFWRRAPIMFAFAGAAAVVGVGTWAALDTQVVASESTVPEPKTVASPHADENVTSAAERAPEHLASDVVVIQEAEAEPTAAVAEPVRPAASTKSRPRKKKPRKKRKKSQKKSRPDLGALYPVDP